MNDPHHADDVNNEASQYIETLVRDHLRTVMKNYQAPEPPLAQHINDVTRPYVIQLAIVGLEQDKDVVLAHLVRAAVNVRRDATGEEVVTTDEFLRRTVNTMMGFGAAEVTAFLQTILEDLVRRDELDEGTPSSGRSSPIGPASGITLSVGNDTMEVSFHDILSCFWSTRLDTVCHTCHQPFVNGPPIRTIARHEPKSPSASNVHVRIFNRHFSCLKARGTFFVPVSHVWDTSIRRVNESKTHDDKAASTLIGTLEALFEGAEDAYDPGVEFWHDYFSVPQWETEIKESLLLCLPAIYHLAEEILVHLSDLPPHYVSLLLIGNLLGAEVSLIEALKKIPLLRALCNSQWMQRMWVTLEYSQSKAACIMDQSNHIRRTREGTGLLARDTFTQLVSGGHTQLLGLFRYAKTFSRSLSLPGEFLGGIAARERGPRQLCLGEAMELVARKQCEVFRDRFLAIHVLLNRDISPNNPPPIPKIEVDACAWVWRSALTKGDYSPLLLQPQECMLSSNPEPGVASWLVGYRSLDGAEWVLGNQETPPRRPPITTEPAVQAELDLVGEIEEIHYLDVEESGEVAGVDWVIGVLDSIANAEGTTLSPERLVDGLNRVFPFDIMHRKAAWQIVNMVLSFRERQERDNEFKSKLEKQLESYNDAPGGEPGRNQRRDAAQEISEILQLDKHILGDISGQVTRLTRSRHVAQHRRDRGAVGGEPICEVRCPKCRIVTLFRLDLRDTGRLGDKLYRIPGLGYSEGVEDGAGLVINKGRITGRMFYGPPACGCQLPEKVEIK